MLWALRRTSSCEALNLIPHASGRIGAAVGDREPCGLGGAPCRRLLKLKGALKYLTRGSFKGLGVEGKGVCLRVRVRMCLRRVPLEGVDKVQGDKILRLSACFHLFSAKPVVMGRSKKQPGPEPSTKASQKLHTQLQNANARPAHDHHNMCIVCNRATVMHRKV